MAVAENWPQLADDRSTFQHYKFRLILIVIGLLLTLGVVAIFIMIYVQQQSGHYNHHEEHFKDKFHTEGSTAFRLVTRNEWLAQPPDNPLLNLNLPVDRVIIAETLTRSCIKQSECILIVRMIQMFHIESRHFDDIAYNFLIGGDGSVYEGRGWFSRGAHTKGYNSNSIGIALIGDFKTITPPMRQFDQLRLLLLEGVRLGKISTNYRLYAQSAFASTESPGEQVVNVIHNWPHFVNKNFVDM